MRYKFETINKGHYITDDKQEIINTLVARILEDKDVQILICIGDHEESDE